MPNGGSQATSFHSGSTLFTPSRTGGSTGLRGSPNGTWGRKGHTTSAMHRGSGSASKESPNSPDLRSTAAAVTGSNKLDSAMKIDGERKGGGITPPVDVKSAQQGPTPLSPDSDAYVMACRDRFIGIAKSLVGEHVVLSMHNGAVHEGVLHTCTPFRSEPFSILLKHVKTKKCPNSAIEVQTALQINAMDMVELHAPHFPNVLHAVNRPPGFATDSDISGVLPGTERTLKPVDNSWMEPLPSGSGSGQMGGLGSSSRGKKWDQFEANEKLYGVKASFDENLYTTQLDKKTLTWNQQCKAERMAWEIESKESHNPHMREERNQAYDKDLDGMSEEMRYSGVQRGTRSLGSPRSSNTSPRACNGHGGRSSIRYGNTSPSSTRGSSVHSRFSASPREGYVSPLSRGSHSNPVSLRGSSSPLSGGGEKVYRPPALRGQNAAMPAAAVAAVENPAVPGGKTRNAEYEAEHQLQQVLDGKLSSRASSSSQLPSIGTNVSEPTSKTTATRRSEGKKTNTTTIAAASVVAPLAIPRQKQKKPTTSANPAGDEGDQKVVKEPTVPAIPPSSPFDGRGGDAAAAAAHSKWMNPNNIAEDDKIQQSSSPEDGGHHGSAKKTGGGGSSPSSLLNPNAKEFKFNPDAKTFTPKPTGGGGRSPQQVAEVRSPVSGGMVTTAAAPMMMPVSSMAMVYPQGVYPGQQPVVFSQGGQQMQVPVISMGQLPYDTGSQVPMIQGYGYQMEYSSQGVPMQGGVGGMGRGAGAASIVMHPGGSGMLPTGTAGFHPMQQQHQPTASNGGGSHRVYPPQQSPIVEDNSSGNHHHQHQAVRKGNQSNQGD